MAFRKVPTAALLAPIVALTLSILFTPFLRLVGYNTTSSSPPTPYKCAPAAYTIEMLSFDPLVIYINNFLYDEEVDYLLNMT